MSTESQRLRELQGHLPAFLQRRTDPWEGLRAEAWFQVGEVLTHVWRALEALPPRVERVSVRVEARRRRARRRYLARE